MFAARSTLQLVLASCLMVILVQSVLAREQLIRILLYKRAEIKGLPYLVQLRRDNGEFFCAGSLLSPQHVLTAAECFDNIDFTKAVVVGAADTLTEDGVQRQIEKVIKHPAYNSQTKHSNAAVLKLKEPMESDNFEFGFLDLVDTPAEEATHAHAGGWRHFVELKPEERGLYYLRHLPAPQEECLRKFNATEESNVFCIVGTEYDGHYCVEDIGSPATFRLKLSGIATSSTDCKTPSYLVKHTNVYNIRSFIQEAMQ